VAFTGADCAVDKEWLKEMLFGINEKEAVAVGGNQRLPQNATSFEKEVHEFLGTMCFVAEYMKNAKELKQVKHNASCNSMYKKSVIDEVGGFDETLWPGEDVDLDHRINSKGYSIIYNPKSLVTHHRPKNLKDFFNMMKRYGWCQAFLLRKHGFFRAPQYVPFLEILFLAGWLWLLVTSLYWGIGLAIGLIAGAVIWFVFKGTLSSFKLFVVALVAWNLGFASYIARRSDIITGSQRKA
ncbi:MAG: glycosyltransferase family 2 protein, partial [Dehalococcoidales bacterium]|nr:glycosyltransferase family 2 protein [Dehalococcoidales bacterium]